MSRCADKSDRPGVGDASNALLCEHGQHLLESSGHKQDRHFAVLSD